MTELEKTLTGLLENLLKTGKEYVEKGRELAEEKLSIPEAGAEREQMLDGMKKGALASAVLVGLLGTRGGRRLTGTAIKIGGLAALGTAAYRGYQRWRSESEQPASASGETPELDVPQTETVSHEYNPVKSEADALLLIKAMVAAANADGRVDDEELRQIKQQILRMRLPAEMAEGLETLIDAPLDANSLAEEVNGIQQACEVYLASRLLIDKNALPSEQAYLSALAEALNLSDTLIESLETEAA